MTMTIGWTQFSSTVYEKFSILNLFCSVRMHSGAFGGAGFVNDSFEEAANGGVRERTFIVALGVLKNFFFAIRLIERQICGLLEFANFQSAARALVKQFDEFAVKFIDAAAPIIESHGATSLFESPDCAAA